MINGVGTPEDIRRLIGVPSEEDLAAQVRLLDVYRSRARLTDAQREIARGVELEAVHRTTENGDGLAEALAMQGRFGEASTVAENPDLAAAMLEKHNAVYAPDVACDCDAFTEKDGYRIPNHYAEAVGYSFQHKASMPFIRCTLCGDLNARPLPPYLAQADALASSSAPDAARLAFYKV